MSDSENETQEAWAAWAGREFVAKFYAMPLRMILDVETKTRTSGKVSKIAFLDCGHQGMLHVWLRVGERMRCRDCYEGGLRAAERMIERVGG